MRIIYIADDGTEFDDKFDCKDYEWKLNHPHLKDVHIFDKYGTEFKDIFMQASYDYSSKIIITNEEALKDFQEFVKYTGFISYESIDKIGEWKFDFRKRCFIENN